MRILSSSKFQAAFIATALSVGGWCFSITDKNLDREHKLEATQTAIKFICLTWFAAIGATGLEDAADKHGSTAPAVPAVQVNTDPQTVTNSPQPLTLDQFKTYMASFPGQPVRVDTLPITPLPPLKVPKK